MPDDRATGALFDELAGGAFAAAYAAAGGPPPPPEVVVLAETESTNDDAKRAAAAGAAAGTAFVADRQRAGRGRQGRRWHAEPGSSLLVSVVSRPAVEAAALPPLALVAGLAVIDALEAQAPGLDLRLKWPNDVWAAGRKIAGVLVEAAFAGGRASWAVVGVGVNVRAGAPPPELAPLVTSLEALGVRGEGLGRGALLGRLLARLTARTGELERGGFAALAGEVRARDALAGRAVRGEGLAGVAAGVADDGRLRVRTPEGREALVGAGEVRLDDEGGPGAGGGRGPSG
ncbi:MAG TPA: biotin--[acetyl-CoA-carboxylase] ligase [Polyangiaceae bacterium]|nr:biotin--[acetyl-CoA-carboxylase] ligase [Polyangiaceae bacterium]